MSADACTHAGQSAPDVCLCREGCACRTEDDDGCPVDPHPYDLPHRDTTTGKEHCMHRAPKEGGGVVLVCCWCGDEFVDPLEEGAPKVHGAYAPTGGCS